ncbi:aldo/keto reductase [Glutamicibacter halophytocola]|uniref:aldo/keto reductase n=1 Tax=Glutamicibacter halophytocola TaxID=1933880 RepID=UPI00321BD077
MGQQGSVSSIELGQGLKVTEQGFGCMSLSSAYGAADDAESLRTVNHVIDSGITFLDTANIYGAGHNESLLAEVLKTRRAEVTLATKAGIVRPKNPGDPRANGSPRLHQGMPRRKPEAPGRGTYRPVLLPPSR